MRKYLYTIAMVFLFAPLCFGISWTNPSLDCQGGPETIKTVHIFEGDQEVATVDVTGKEGQDMHWDHTVLPDGTHTLSLVVEDMAGNMSDTCSAAPTVTIDNGDRTPPASCANLKP